MSEPTTIAEYIRARSGLLSVRTYRAVLRSVDWGVLGRWTLDGFLDKLSAKQVAEINIRGVGERAAAELEQLVGTSAAVLSSSICELCGASIVDYGYPRKYCSNRCMGIARRKGKSIECRQCGKQFVPYSNNCSQKYCDRDCYRASRRAGINSCARCGGALNTGKLFCSHACAKMASRSVQTQVIINALRGGMKVADASIHFKKTTAYLYQLCSTYHIAYTKARPTRMPSCPRLCVVCGAVCPKGKQKYCGEEHRAEAQRLRFTKTCLTCGKDFHTRYDWQKTCSRTCGFRYRDQ